MHQGLDDPNGLRELRKTLRDRRKDIAASMAEYPRRARSQGRANLSRAETHEFQKRRRLVRAIDERIKELNGEIKRTGTQSPVLQRITAAEQGARSVPVKVSRAAQVAPLTFDPESLRRVHQGVVNGEPRRIEARAFNSVDSLLPAQLWPTVIGPMHDNRILDRIPTFQTELPVVEYIRHTATTGAPAIVAEGAAKPELVFTTDRVLATVQKIAAHAGVSWEIIQDWESFFSYVQTELAAQVVDVENAEILSGAGTTGHLAGFLTTSGILTHTMTTETALDAVEMAVAKLRVGAAKATADLFILHPSTWSAIRRTKDGQSRYLTAPDPTAGEASSVWGVPVLVTTQLASGKGVLLDTTKFGRALVREPLNLRFGYNVDDFTKNIYRVIAEERLTLQVERPPAVLALDGLPTS
ncbi:phage major capsid protein [Mycobacterium kyogaense]|uniref:phage major capsid protein n=1 Tax=Mycobacterium kyogaense TaxID=2212479 RepID=UPI000DAE76D2|nr:phage major capsid protein [Mycobacterium kyogaense]